MAHRDAAQTRQVDPTLRTPRKISRSKVDRSCVQAAFPTLKTGTRWDIHISVQRAKRPARYPTHNNEGRTGALLRTSVRVSRLLRRPTVGVVRHLGLHVRAIWTGVARGLHLGLLRDRDDQINSLQNNIPTKGSSYRRAWGVMHGVERDGTRSTVPIKGYRTAVVQNSIWTA